MKILDEHNQILETDNLNRGCYYSVLRFKDSKNPDFYFQDMDYIEEFISYTMKLSIGEHICYVPFHWSILCSDLENIQTIPLYELSGRQFDVFCINPIDGFLVQYLPIRMIEVFPNTTWSCPPIKEKDMLVSPIAEGKKNKGALCAIFSPYKLDIHRPLSDIL